MSGYYVLRVLCFLFVLTQSMFDLGFKDASDLTSFITRPEIKAPIFNVTTYHPNDIAPGYWFVAPYASLIQERFPPKYYQTCQTGPHIYDQTGQLIWTGSCEFKNQNACDFKLETLNGTEHISTILFVHDNDTTGRGVIMDASYQRKHEITVPPTVTNFNMHELNLIDDGKAALHILWKPEYVDITCLPHVNRTADAGFVANMGFREVDVSSGRTLFEWWALDHVSIAESTTSIQLLNGPYPKCWNWFHANSIEKNVEGDYLLSARYTDCVYKISGKDGQVLWRLGGTKSDFQLDGFNFSRQHDARWVRQASSTKEVVSLLDNGGDEYGASSLISSAIIVELDKTSMPMKARVRKRWIRPDFGRSKMRGNFQLLPNGNAFIGWSENSYISEHDAEGKLLMEAKFNSDRFVTYRSYKFNFTGNPTERPTLTAHAYGTNPQRSTMVYYVSWNGATEVATWSFHRKDGSEIGRMRRTGFETMFQSSAFEMFVFARAIASDGTILGESLETTVEMPNAWKQSVMEEGDSNPQLISGSKLEL